MTQATALTIRLAAATDAEGLRRVAELDSARTIEGDALVAEAGTDIVAAVALADGRVTANPFRPTADVVDLLRRRRAQLLAGGARRRRARTALLPPAAVGVPGLLERTRRFRGRVAVVRTR